MKFSYLNEEIKQKIKNIYKKAVETAREGEILIDVLKRAEEEIEGEFDWLAIGEYIGDVSCWGNCPSGLTYINSFVFIHFFYDEKTKRIISIMGEAEWGREEGEYFKTVSISSIEEDPLNLESFKALLQNLSPESYEEHYEELNDIARELGINLDELWRELRG